MATVITKATRRLAATTLSLLALSAASCSRSQEPCYAQFQSPGADGWQQEKWMEFDPWPLDSLNGPQDCYDMAVCVRHTERLDADTLWLAMETSSLQTDGFARDTVALAIRDGKGAFRGKGSHGLVTVTDTVKSNFSLPRGFHVSIAHAMDSNSLEGIENVGIILIRKR